jgi:hypothetical protein
VELLLGDEQASAMAYYHTGKGNAYFLYLAAKHEDETILRMLLQARFRDSEDSALFCWTITHNSEDAAVALYAAACARGKLVAMEHVERVVLSKMTRLFREMVAHSTDNFSYETTRAMFISLDTNELSFYIKNYASRFDKSVLESAMRLPGRNMTGVFDLLVEVCPPPYNVNLLSLAVRHQTQSPSAARAAVNHVGRHHFQRIVSGDQGFHVLMNALELCFDCRGLLEVMKALVRHIFSSSVSPNNVLELAKWCISRRQLCLLENVVLSVRPPLHTQGAGLALPSSSKSVWLISFDYTAQQRTCCYFPWHQYSTKVQAAGELLQLIDFLYVNECVLWHRWTRCLAHFKHLAPRILLELIVAQKIDALSELLVEFLDPNEQLTPELLRECLPTATHHVSQSL